MVSITPQGGQHLVGQFPAASTPVDPPSRPLTVLLLGVKGRVSMDPSGIVRCTLL